jgi:hypothetical protein
MHMNCHKLDEYLHSEMNLTCETRLVFPCSV